MTAHAWTLGPPVARCACGATGNEPLDSLAPDCRAELNDTPSPSRQEMRARLMADYMAAVAASSMPDAQKAERQLLMLDWWDWL